MQNRLLMLMSQKAVHNQGGARIAREDGLGDLSDHQSYTGTNLGG